MTISALERYAVHGDTAALAEFSMRHLGPNAATSCPTHPCPPTRCARDAGVPSSATQLAAPAVLASTSTCMGMPEYAPQLPIGRPSRRAVCADVIGVARSAITHRIAQNDICPEKPAAPHRTTELGRLDAYAVMRQEGRAARGDPPVPDIHRYARVGADLSAAHIAQLRAGELERRTGDRFAERRSRNARQAELRGPPPSARSWTLNDTPGAITPPGGHLVQSAIRWTLLAPTAPVIIWASPARPDARRPTFS